jgi:hypothetical protein
MTAAPTGRGAQLSSVWRDGTRVGCVRRSAGGLVLTGVVVGGGRRRARNRPYIGTSVRSVGCWSEKVSLISARISADSAVFRAQNEAIGNAGYVSAGARVIVLAR